MARNARVELFDPDEIAIVHAMNRTVRRCPLLGLDPTSGRNYDYRKRWIESELQRLAQNFGIDLLCYSVLSNHFHLVLRSRPDVVRQWSDTEVARRWLLICPKRRDASGNPKEPNEYELNSILKTPAKVKEIRSRLSDFSWWMRLLSQKVAQRANREDKEVGKFWQSRYRAVRLLDETAILACASYVDLNPIRAAIAETIETSAFTSAQQRALELQQPYKLETAIQSPTSDKQDPLPMTMAQSLSPVFIDEMHGELGACCHVSGARASDKGFLPIGVADYLSLLDWTARELRSDKNGSTPVTAKLIFERLGIDEKVWCELARNFGRLFSSVAGKPSVMESTRSRKRNQRYTIKSQAIELFAA